MGTVGESSLDGGVPAGGRDMGRLATDESKQNHIFGGYLTCKRTVGEYPEKLVAETSGPYMKAFTPEGIAVCSTDASSTGYGAHWGPSERWREDL